MKLTRTVLLLLTCFTTARSGPGPLGPLRGYFPGPPAPFMSPFGRTGIYRPMGAAPFGYPRPMPPSFMPYNPLVVRNGASRITMPPYPDAGMGIHPLRRLPVPGGGSLLVHLADGRKAILPDRSGAARGQRPIILPRGSSVAGASSVPYGLIPQYQATLSGSFPAGYRIGGILPSGTWEALTNAIRRRQLGIR